MTTDRWTEARRVFEDALNCVGEDRAAFLRRRCAGDPELQHDVEALLAADTSARDGAFIRLAIRDSAAHVVEREHVRRNG